MNFSIADEAIRYLESLPSGEMRAFFDDSIDESASTLPSSSKGNYELYSDIEHQHVESEGAITCAADIKELVELHLSDRQHGIPAFQCGNGKWLTLESGRDINSVVSEIAANGGIDSATWV